MWEVQASSQGSTIDLFDRHAGQVNILNTADIDSDHFVTRRRSPVGIGADTADFAKMVGDMVLVKGVGANILRQCVQLHLRCGHKPQQMPLALADRAIARCGPG